MDQSIFQFVNEPILPFQHNLLFTKLKCIKISTLYFYVYNYSEKKSIFEIDRAKIKLKGKIHHITSQSSIHLVLVTSRTYLAVIGSDTISSPTLSTSTTRFISYFFIVFDMKFTVTLISLWGGIVPDDGIISNSLGGPAPRVTDGEPISLLALSRSLVPQTLSVTPSPGTLRWNFIGTKEVLVNVHVCVFKNPVKYK